MIPVCVKTNLGPEAPKTPKYRGFSWIVNCGWRIGESIRRIGRIGPISIIQM